ncbi:MAG TPA: NAD(P)H-binding protein [Novosphingobium sp.]|nr:NAD(P)H-binding protein [Novosphingobium sp.]
MKVLVVGATGRTGRLLCAELMARGMAVRALVRRRDETLPANVEQAVGDLREGDVFARLLPGCDAAIYTACGTGGADRGLPRLVDCEAVAACAAQAASQGAQVVLLSSAAVTQPEHPHNCSFDAVLKWKYRGEQALRTSGARYTVVRALGLRDRPAGQAGVRVVQGDRIAFGEDIARGDVACLLADVVAGGGLGAAMPAASLAGTTIEIYNDASIAPGIIATARHALRPDRPVTPFSRGAA